MVKPVDQTQAVKATPGALTRIKSLEDRLDLLEATFGSMVGQLNNTLSGLDQRGANHAGYIQALVNVVGEDKVNEALKIAQAARAAKEVADAKAWLAGEVEAGRLVPSEVVAETSFIVGLRTDKDGNETPNNHVQVWANQLLPEVKAAYLGNGVGAKATLSDGDVIEVLEIYEPATPAPKVEAETEGDKLDKALQEVEAQLADAGEGEDAKVLEFPAPASSAPAEVVAAEDESSKKTEG